VEVTEYTNFEHITRPLVTIFCHSSQLQSSRTNCSVSAYCILPYVTTTNFLNKLFSLYYILAHGTTTQLLNKLLDFYLPHFTTGDSNTVPEHNCSACTTLQHSLQQHSYRMNCSASTYYTGCFRRNSKYFRRW